MTLSIIKLNSHILQTSFLYISTQTSCFPAGNLNSYLKIVPTPPGCSGDENDFPYVLAKTFFFTIVSYEKTTTSGHTTVTRQGKKTMNFRESSGC